MWNKQLVGIALFTVIACAVIALMLGHVTEKFVNNNAEIISLQPKQATDSIYLFSDNKCSPECCLQGSAFSCSSGCVCMTENQKIGLVRRGNNAGNVPPDMTTDMF
jgi:hypothetical protein